MKKKIAFKQIRFLTSALEEVECPSLRSSRGNFLPEMAVVGRSNVGKSSLINHLLQNKSLAKVSSTPGKTQRMNFFLIDDTLLLVDLPGYGYAKVDKSTKRNWGIYLENYLNARSSLKLLLFLIDIRRLPKEEDLAFLQWAQNQDLRVSLVLTKADKLKKREREKQTEEILELLDKTLDRKTCSSRLPLIHYSVKEGKCKHQLIEVINKQLWD